ncbi:DNA-methyltransferase [Brachybacterium paraconglomeratum]|uniref:DNA-methyltransferase n=1 Tax=Brachybacterium paraconglomeratum TaxID=173362 RepID=UPI0037CA6E4E
MTIYYQDGHVTLYHGDAREIAPGIKADAIVTDPPYGDTSLSWDTWPTGWVGAVSHIPQMWCFGSMRMFLTHGHEFTGAGYRYGQDIVWEKHNGSGFANDRFKRVHEHAIQWYRGAWGDVSTTPQFTADATKRVVRRKERPTHTGAIEGSTFISEDGGPRLMRSVLAVRSMHGQALHPTEKPGGILSPLIRYSARPTDLVLDPFAGSGSTLVTALSEGRAAVGIEANEAYCEIIARRLDQGVLNLGGIA